MPAPFILTTGRSRAGFSHRRAGVMVLFLAASIPSPRAGAGGPEWMRPQPTAEQKRAREIAARWDEVGLAAAPEMIDALCRDDRHLAGYANNHLAQGGRPALTLVVQAATRRGCQLAETIASLVCRDPQGSSELVGMLKGAQPLAVATAVETLSLVAKPGVDRTCARGAEILTQALPALGSLLRTSSGETLSGALSAAQDMAALAAPLVPDLLPLLLRKEDATAKLASLALGAIGPKAAPAVPALRQIARQNPGRRQAAIVALGGIGEPARAALPDLAPLLKETLPSLCRAKPRFSDADSLAVSIVRAVGVISGPGAEPLVPDLMTAFERLHVCGLLGSSLADWIRSFGALGRHGAHAAPLLVTVALDPEQDVAIRRQAISSIDQMGTPSSALAEVARIRKALERKRQLFTPRPTPIMQQLPPPPTTPPELAPCRQEAGLPPLPEPSDPGAPDPAAAHRDETFGPCVRRRLCGPDADTYRATLAACCRGYGASPPWFCAARADTRGAPP